LAAVRDAQMMHVGSAASAVLKQDAIRFLVRATPGLPTREMAMISNPMTCALLAGAVITLAALASSPVVAALPAGAGTDEATDVRPVMIAQAARPGAALAPTAIAPNDAFPAYQRGVRAAAATSNEALRRYVWRTRMIYNFYYPDFASGE
jgi:hypothetical protein